MKLQVKATWTVENDSWHEYDIEDLLDFEGETLSSDEISDRIYDDLWHHHRPRLNISVREIE